ncbi:MAG: beta strand repeat-containing protein [Fimbriiglobus sp.]
MLLFKRFFRLAITAAAVAGLAGPAAAATPDIYTWNGTDGAWSTAANWDTVSVPPSATTTVTQFTGGNTFTSTNDLGSSFNLNSLVIDSGYTGSDSTLAAGTAGGRLNFVANDGIDGTIQMDGSGSFHINHNLRIGGVGGTLTLSGNDGQLWIGNDTAAGFANGPGNIALNGGTLVFNGNGGDLSYIAVGSPGGAGGVISNGGLSAGRVEIDTAGNGMSVYLFGTNTYTGGTDLVTGNLVVGNNKALGTGALNVFGSGNASLSGFDDGNYTLGNAVSLRADLTLGRPTSQGLTLAGTVTLVGDGAQDDHRHLDLNGSNTTISGTIQASSLTSGVGLVVFGTGSSPDQRLTLTGQNTYTGFTAVENATLALSGTGSLASNRIEVGSGGTFDVSAVTGGYKLGAGVTLTGDGLDASTFAATVRTGASFTAEAGSRVTATSACGCNDPSSMRFEQSAGVTTFAAGSVLSFRVIDGTPGAAPNTGLSGGDPFTNSVYTFAGSGTVNFQGTFEIDGTDGIFTNGESYSFLVGTVPTGAAVSITDQARFSFVGFAASNASFTAAGGQMFLNFTPVPEPGTLLAVGAGALGLVRGVRRRRVTTV